MSDLVRGHHLWTNLAILAAGVVAALVAQRFYDSPDSLPFSILILLIFLGIAGWRWREQRKSQAVGTSRQAILDAQRHREELLGQFSICKRVEDFDPEDLGFERLTPGFASDIRRRPFFAIYLPRQIVPFEEVGFDVPRVAYPESKLRQDLEAGGDFVLLGPPTMGKSRTLFEIVSGLEDWMVVSPKLDSATPSSDVFDELFSGKKVVLVLDDLNDFADAIVDLGTFCGPNGLGKAQAFSVAATCRDGAELGAVKNAQGRTLRRFFDQIQLKLSFLPQTPEEKSRLAASAGRAEWEPATADDYPTPGTIVMEDALVFMRQRYETLPGERRDTLRAIKLLTEAGVLPLHHERIAMTLKSVFRRSEFHLGDCLTGLADDGFLRRPGDQDPVLPESAYLEDVVVRYADDRSVQEDFPALQDSLKVQEDAEGLALLGLTYGMTLANPAKALAAFDIALEIRSDDARFLINRAASLDAMGYHSEALLDIGAALRLDPENPIALLNQGAALGALGHHDEAVASLDAAIALSPNHPDILINRASALSSVGRFNKGLEDANTALKLSPDHPVALNVRGGILAQLGKYPEALADIDASLRLRPNDPKANYNRALALQQLERYQDALDAFDASLAVNPAQFLAYFNRGLVLSSLNRDEDALASFDAALEIVPDDIAALNSRGVSLSQLGQLDLALAAFDASLEIQPEYPVAIFNRGVVLEKLGRHDEAREDYDRFAKLESDDVEVIDGE